MKKIIKWFCDLIDLFGADICFCFFKNLIQESLVKRLFRFNNNISLKRLMKLSDNLAP